MEASTELITASLVLITLAVSGVAALPWTAAEQRASLTALLAPWVLTGSLVARWSPQRVVRPAP